MNKKIIYILFFLGITSFAKAQTDTLTVSVDTKQIVLEEFRDKLQEEYTGNDFDYTTVEGEAENILARFINWIFKGLRNVFGIEIDPTLAEVFKNMIYIICIGIVIYILIRVLAGKDAASFFRKKNKTIAPIDFSEEHIENIDLDQLIKEALSANDYRLAIRYMYLKILQDLSLKQVIDYHFEKTNNDYHREIKDDQLKQNFNKVSYLYDYIWYGKFDINEEKYQSAKQSFEQLNLKIEQLG